jgi:dicarboxylate/amino acid:cation (Na+ or H+) symporter, DAACS family
MKRQPMPLHTRVLLALILGATAGLVAQNALGADNETLKTIVANFTKPVGNIFLNLIFMVVVPLLFSALVLGVTELGGGGKIGRVGLRSLGLTLVLSSIAVGIGLVGVNLVKPGGGISGEEKERLIATYGDVKKADESVAKSKEAKTFAETVVDIIPKNPLESAVKALEGGLIAFMFFALIFGVALASIEAEKALPVKQFLEGLLAVSMKIIEYAMRFAPYGVFALVFTTMSALGWSALAALGKYALLVLICLALHLFGVYSLVLKFIAKRSPLEFFRAIRPTSSSNATLPTALRSSEEDLGIPRSIGNFVLTVGATANQNGTALFEGITVLFLAQVWGVDLSLAQQATVMGLAIVAGIGTAGVPGGAWPYIAIILVSIGVPAQAIALCIGIDRILDMSRTVLNVTGDMTIAACVAQMEGTPEVIPEEAR